MANVNFDPDQTSRDDPSYWAIVFLRATERDNKKRAELARRELARLGVQMTYRVSRAKRAVGDAH